jgi:hypothetical protein
VHESAREEFTNIRVSREGRWFTGEKEIINFKVISHFKQNLHRDANGIYIYQTFREFAEKGYITVAGPLLSLFRIDGDRLIFDSLDELPLAQITVVLNSDDGAPYIWYPRIGCYASVPAGVSPYFAELLEEVGDRFAFCGRPVEVRVITGWS